MYIGFICESNRVIREGQSSQKLIFGEIASFKIEYKFLQQTITLAPLIMTKLMRYYTWR